LSHASVTCLLLKLRQSDSLTKGKTRLIIVRTPSLLETVIRVPATLECRTLSIAHRESKLLLQTFDLPPALSVILNLPHQTTLMLILTL